MVAAGAVIWHADQEPTVLAIWDRLRPVESLPVLIYLFVAGPNLARYEVRVCGAVAVRYYVRDDEMTLFHGRNQVAYYTESGGAVWKMTEAQFDELERASSGRLGLS